MGLPNPNPYRGLFVVFEGLDGSGNSTQAGLFANWMRPLLGERSVLKTKEPTDHVIGAVIRDSLKHLYQRDPFGLQLAFTADRRYHLAWDVIPALEGGGLVVSDRYMYSTFAYGSVGVAQEDMAELISTNHRFIAPDITILLKVPMEECARRMAKSRTERELFEEVKTLRQVWDAYERLVGEYPEVHLLDGHRSPNEVFSDVLKVAASNPKFRELIANVEID